VLNQVAQRTVSLRQSHPRVKAPSSIFEFSIDDAASIISYSDSVMSATDFSFDDVIVNSKAYRRALASVSSQNLSAQARRQRVDSDVDTVVGAEMTVSKTSANSKSLPQMRDAREDWGLGHANNSNEKQVKAVTETSRTPKISPEMREVRRAWGWDDGENDKEEPVKAVAIQKKGISPPPISKVVISSRDVFCIHTVQLANAFSKLTRIEITVNQSNEVLWHTWSK
jgi:hypothetical protein